MAASDVSIPGSTREGWSAFLLLILGVVKAAGWIPPEMDNATLITAVSLVVSAFVFALGKLGKRGSTPFVPDAPKP